jgi:hypothetical protein
MASVRKAQQVLDRLERSAGLTREGKDWLITAVDPFHDTDVRPDGYPDIMMGGSVVQLVKQQMTVQCPSTVTSGTWDCMIYNLPWLDSQPCTSYQVNTCDINIATGTQANGNMGGILAAAGPTGTTLNFTTGVPPGITSIGLVDQYFEGPSRVIAQGLEIHNTTSPLNAQGAVTVWRQPQPTRGTRHNMRLITGSFASPTMVNVASTEFRAQAPGSIGEAQTLLGSRTWEAKEGAYIVFTQNDQQLRDPFNEPVWPAMMNTSSNIPAVLTGPAFYGTPSYSMDYTQLHDFNMSGAYFTGLSLQTTLTVNWNVYLERFPTSQQTDLVVLATPSPKYDPLALELYTRILSDMPVGVMVKENGLGTWFAEAVSSVAPYVSGALSAIPHPLAQGASLAAGLAGKAAGRYLAPPNASGDPLAQLKAKQKRKKAAAKGHAVARGFMKAP